MHIPYAGWTAGLSSWRLKNYEQAANFFSNFSISLKDDVWHQASGSFWAARAYAKLNQYEDINFWLKRAANNPDSFYGLLAMQILGIEIPFVLIILSKVVVLTSYFLCFLKEILLEAKSENFSFNEFIGLKK